MISPISSGKIYTSDKIADYNGSDLFNNVRKIKNVKCPLFIIHGKKDKQISQTHSIELVNRARCKIMVWYPSNGNNNNIYEKYRMKFIIKIKKFLSYCRDNINSNEENKINCINIEEEAY